MNGEMKVAPEVARDVLIDGLAADLSEAIANLGYPVGMGVAPNPQTCRVAAVNIIDRITPKALELIGEGRRLSTNAKLVEALKSRLARFEAAIADVTWVADRLASGQQFNAYASATNGEDTDDADCLMFVGIGPVTDFRFITEVTGRQGAELLEAALKLAAETRAALSGEQSNG